LFSYLGALNNNTDPVIAHEYSLIGHSNTKS